MTDPYRVLNVPRSADQATIKQAYRKLAKTLHPDRNPGNARAEQRFKEVSQAYDLLSDPAKRARFDRGEIDAEGRPRHDFGLGGFGAGFGGRGFGAGAAGPQGASRSGAESLFEKMFGGAFTRGFAGAQTGGPGADATFEELLRSQARGAGATPRQKLRGADRRYRLEIDFLDAARGGRQRLQLEDGRTIEVDVPAGCESGKTLRLKGQGAASPLGGPAGDALVQIEVRRHPQFSREGHDIHVEVPIALSAAVLGTRIAVPTLDGPVRMNVPPGANGGRRLRLKGRGIARPDGGRGDQYVRLLVTLPEPPDAELADWARRHPQDTQDDPGKD